VQWDAIGWCLVQISVQFLRNREPFPLPLLHELFHIHLTRATNAQRDAKQIARMTRREINLPIPSRKPRSKLSKPSDTVWSVLLPQYGQKTAPGKSVVCKQLRHDFIKPRQLPCRLKSFTLSRRGEPCFPILLAVFFHLFGSEGPAFSLRFFYIEFL
jgi:hypothetical protein